MSEWIPPDHLKAQARLRLVRRARPPRASDSLWVLSGAEGTQPIRDTGRLISSRDAAISRSLQEETQLVLATLTPRERLVLEWRFGVALKGDPPSKDIDEMLAPGEISVIEAAALRKLRHPSQGVRLKSVDRR